MGLYACTLKAGFSSKKAKCASQPSGVARPNYCTTRSSAN